MLIFLTDIKTMEEYTFLAPLLLGQRKNLRDLLFRHKF